MIIKYKKKKKNKHKTDYIFEDLTHCFSQNGVYINQLPTFFSLIFFLFQFFLPQIFQLHFHVQLHHFHYFHLPPLPPQPIQLPYRRLGGNWCQHLHALQFYCLTTFILGIINSAPKSSTWLISDLLSQLLYLILKKFHWSLIVSLNSWKVFWVVLTKVVTASSNADGFLLLLRLRRWNEWV